MSADQKAGFCPSGLREPSPSSHYVEGLTVCALHGVRVEIRGQLTGVGSLLLTGSVPGLELRPSALASSPFTCGALSPAMF